MTNRKFSLLFFLGLSFGLLAMDAPEKMGNVIFEDALVDAVRDNDVKEVSRLLCSDAGPDYMKQEGDMAFLNAIIYENKKIIYLLLVYGNEKELLAVEGVVGDEENCTALSLAQEAKNPEILDLVTTLMRKRTKSDFPKILFSPGIQDYLKNLIDNEKKSIKVAMYWLRDHYLESQIEDRLKNKVETKLIYDQSCDPGIPQHLCNKGALVKKWTKDEGLMHHKFWVFGESIGSKQLVVTGSYNATNKAEDRNRENIVVLDDKKVIKKFLKQFESLWNNPHAKELKKRKGFLESNKS